jgi:hypothetical protein
MEKAVGAVDKYYQLIFDCVGRVHRTFLRNYRWNQLLACFEVVGRFLRWTELRGTKLCDAFGQVLACYQEIMVLSMKGNAYADHLGARFLHRMYHTQDLAALMLTYILTEKGRNWYIKLPRKGEVNSQASVWSIIGPTLAFFTTLLGAAPELIRSTLQDYLAEGYTKEGQAPLDFWSDMLAQAQTCKARTYLQPKSRVALAIMALVLCNLPLSEAEAERVFSHMRQLFGDRARSMGDDLIEARLTIKLRRLIKPNEICAGCAAFAALGEDVSAQLQQFLNEKETRRESRLHWGDVQLTKKIARQYPKP